ncbi:MAG: hypothetical protein AABX48_00685 [Nanoarchaeota archaeon]
MGSETRNRLVEYFKKNIKKGYSADSLRWTLIKQGYARSIVDLALAQACKEIESVKENKEKPTIKHELYDENDNKVYADVKPKKSWWKRIFDFD